ncbi:hypothetical protein [Micromonospora sp. KC723]|uniref:hypothetical protein n=1 Tax=Micromonospora sp. KC723 TaxID=2530381 RepID=UPI00104821EA|nr:hypothetical protein [Micromonospora sp. KC723]TDB70151.1 hypothetical protein E1165_26570 [Micromonospora sp. KC723]
MQTVFSSVLPDVPAAAVIWLVLLVAVAVAVGALVARPGWLRSTVAGRIRQAALPSHVELAEEERERARYAEEVAVAAERAGATAARCRTEWLTAQEEVEAAWAAYEAAEADVRRLSAAAAMPLPQTTRTPSEYADRERFLHRAALDAYWRKEISVEQLSDVFAHRNGWDPRRHPVEQELLLRRAARDNLAERHRAALEREREAWRAAELAVASAHSLRDEAYAARDRQPEEVESVVPMPERERVRPAESTRDAPTVARGRAAVAVY